MKLILYVCLMIVCVYCDTNSKEYEKEIKDHADLEDGLIISRENVTEGADLKDRSEISNEYTKFQLPYQQSEVKPENIDQSKSAENQTQHLKEELELSENKDLSNTTDVKASKVERTSKTKRVHHRKHHSHKHRHRHNHKNREYVCHHEKHRQHQKKCYKLKKGALRQEKLAKILYPNGVPFQTPIPIDIRNETGLSFGTVIKARKTHDKKVKVWLKKLRKIKLYKRRKEHKRIKTNSDIENTTAAL